MENQALRFCRSLYVMFLINSMQVDIASSQVVWSVTVDQDSLKPRSVGAPHEVDATLSLSGSLLFVTVDWYYNTLSTKLWTYTAVFTQTSDFLTNGTNIDRMVFDYRNSGTNQREMSVRISQTSDEDKKFIVKSYSSAINQLTTEIVLDITYCNSSSDGLPEYAIPVHSCNYTCTTDLICPVDYLPRIGNATCLANATWDSSALVCKETTTVFTTMEPTPTSVTTTPPKPQVCVIECPDYCRGGCEVNTVQYKSGSQITIEVGESASCQRSMCNVAPIQCDEPGPLSFECERF